MPRYSSICLFDIPGLGQLEEVCNRLQVRLYAHGGLVRRFVGNRCNKPAPEIFDLIPFSSDIDLLHNGPDALTPKLVQTIHDLVPHAECFRWEVRSVKAQAEFDSAIMASGIVPANLMRLSSSRDEGLYDPWDGIKDIRSKKYRYIRNGFYDKSSLYQAGRDLEFFSVLLYCQTLLEGGVTESFKDQPGIADAKAVVGAMQTSQVCHALQNSAYLRIRLLYLMSRICATASVKRLNDVFESIGFDKKSVDFLKECHGWLGKQLDAISKYPNQALSSSSWLEGDDFRLPVECENWEFFKDKEYPFNSGFTLGGYQRVLFASPLLAITPGVSPSSKVVGLTSQFPNDQTESREFLYFNVPIRTDAREYLFEKYNDKDLAAVLAFYIKYEQTDTTSDPKTLYLPVPSICHLRWEEFKNPDIDGVLLVSCSVFGILENIINLQPPELDCKSWPDTQSQQQKVVEVSLQILVLGLEGQIHDK
jgi:hypothetical protein